MDLKEKVERSKALYAQARSILENKDATAEDKAKVQGILAEAAALKADAVQMKHILAAAVELDVPIYAVDAVVRRSAALQQTALGRRPDSAV